MRIEITARSLELSEGMRDRIEKRMLKLKRYFDGVLECHVIAQLERFIYKYEITLHGNGFDLFAEAHGEDLHAAFEAAADKVERQVRKLKDRIRSRRGRRPADIPRRDDSEETNDLAEEFEGR
jgi:putative sigma-54 modulation protein